MALGTAAPVAASSVAPTRPPARTRPLAWSVAVVVVVLSVAFPDTPDALAAAVVAVTVLTLGIPHGAVDHLVGTSRRPAGPAFHLRYLAAVAVTLALWALSPRGALGFFLVVSVHHFGQSDLAGLGLTRLRQFAAQVSYGLFVVATPLLAHLDSITPTVERLAGVRPTEWAWLAEQSTWWITTTVAQYLVCVALCVRTGRMGSSHVISLLLLTTVFITAHPLVGFAVYFGLWHSLDHIGALRRVLAAPGATEPIAVRTFARLAMPMSVLSFLGLGVVVLALAVTDRTADVIPALFVLVSAITVPHLAVVESMWRRRS